MNINDTINLLRKQFISNLLKAYKNKFIDDPIEITIDDLYNKKDKDMKPVISIQEMVNKLLQEYAYDNCLLPRSSMDLSPLESWLMLKYYKLSILLKDTQKVYDQMLHSKNEHSNSAKPDEA